MRFLANARDYSVICDIGETRGDSRNESPLFRKVREDPPDEKPLIQGILPVYYL